MKNFVLSYEWYEENGWYGDRFRAVLFMKADKTFNTKTEINPHKTAFKNFINKKWNLKSKVKELIITNLDDLKTYEHCSHGPSYSCSHRNVTVLNLQEVK